MGSGGIFAPLTEQEDLAILKALRDNGRLVDPSEWALPAEVRVEHVGGHTPGQVIVHVDTADGLVIVASDAVHLYEELDRDRPFIIASDVPDMYRGYDRLRELGDRGARILAGHDPLVMSSFVPLTAPDNEQIGVTIG